MALSGSSIITPVGHNMSLRQLLAVPNVCCSVPPRRNRVLQHLYDEVAIAVVQFRMLLIELYLVYTIFPNSTNQSLLRDFVI